MHHPVLSQDELMYHQALTHMYHGVLSYLLPQCTKVLSHISHQSSERLDLLTQINQPMDSLLLTHGSHWEECRFCVVILRNATRLSEASELYPTSTTCSIHVPIAFRSLAPRFPRAASSPVTKDHSEGREVGHCQDVCRNHGKSHFAQRRKINVNVDTRRVVVKCPKQ